MSDPKITAFVTSLRDDLHAEFQPRADRTLKRWPVDLSETVLAGCRCQNVRPWGQTPSEVLVYVFGGGYVSGCPEYELPITAALAVQANLTIIAPYYPLAPEHPFPAAVDVAVDVWKATTDKHTCIGIAGESAGGGLALAVTHACAAQGLDMPRSVTLFSPWCDLTHAGIEACSGIDDPTVDVPNLHHMAKAVLQGAQATDHRASPGLAPIPQNWPRTYLSTGSNDRLRPGVLALHRALQAAGKDSHLFDAKDMWHVFELYDETDAADVSLQKVVQFLRNDDPVTQ